MKLLSLDPSKTSNTFETVLRSWFRSIQNTVENLVQWLRGLMTKLLATNQPTQAQLINRLIEFYPTVVVPHATHVLKELIGMGVSPSHAFQMVSML